MTYNINILKQSVIRRLEIIFTATEGEYSIKASGDLFEIY